MRRYTLIDTRYDSTIHLLLATFLPYHPTVSRNNACSSFLIARERRVKGGGGYLVPEAVVIFRDDTTAGLINVSTERDRKGRRQPTGLSHRRKRDLARRRGKENTGEDGAAFARFDTHVALYHIRISSQTSNNRMSSGGLTANRSRP